MRKLHWQWQLYWRRWHLPSYSELEDTFGPTICVFVIGPLQIRWFHVKRT